MSRCPTCAKEATPRAANAAFPFCSPRCRQVDLGRWLNEEYRIAVGPAGGDDVMGPASSAPEDPS